METAGPAPRRRVSGCCWSGLAAMLAMGCAAGYAYWYINVVVDDCYAVWRTAGLVAEHLDRNDGAWPKSWDDLRRLEEAGFHWAPKTVPFENLPRRVEVDWQADPAKLLATPDDGAKPPFKVVWLRDGGTHFWSGYEPNRIILDRLKERAKPPPR